MKDRLRKVRKELDLTQQEFAERIGSSQNVLANYEIGRRNPSNSVINNICKTFNINESWLRDGEGSMFIEIPEEDLYSRAAASVLKEDDPVAMEGLKLYYSLPTESKKAVKNYILQLADMIREHENKKE